MIADENKHSLTAIQWFNKGYDLCTFCGPEYRKC